MTATAGRFFAPSRWIPGEMNERARGLRPAIAVDLGFSGKHETTGISVLLAEREGFPFAAKCFTFAGAVEQTAQSLKGSSEAALIIEAPLSACFGSNGNPSPRAPFELRRHKGKNASRYWYSGAGAATMLAAVFFLRELDCALSEFDHQGEIHIFEGFLSFKTKGTDHAQDASRLLQKFRTADGLLKVKSDSEAHVVSALDLLAGTNQRYPASEVIVIGGRC
jgi:hypothetical protein